MTSEMPKKYWRNLPEAAAIPELIRTHARERKMVASHDRRNEGAENTRLRPRRCRAISQQLRSGLAALPKPLPPASAATSAARNADGVW